KTGGPQRDPDDERPRRGDEVDGAPAGRRDRLVARATRFRQVGGCGKREVRIASARMSCLPLKLAVFAVREEPQERRLGLISPSRSVLNRLTRHSSWQPRMPIRAARGRFSTIFNRRGTEEGLWHSCFLTRAPARAGK